MMKTVTLSFFLFIAAGSACAESYRSTLTMYLENKSSFANHVQVRDVEARHGFPEDCRVARKVAKACEGGRDRRERHGEREIRCAAALALLEEPRCAVKDLIFDDWMDAGAVVELTIYAGREGFGTVAVRAVNNTESWTFKPGIRDGDTVGHQ